jgi:hypothetical protein
MDKMVGVYGGIPTTRSVGGWTRHEVGATPETLYKMLMEAYMSCTFGNDEPVLIRMGQGFHDTLVARVNVSRQATNDSRKGAYLGEAYLPTTIPDVDAPTLDPIMRMDVFMGAKILLDERFDSWTAHIYQWDRESYELPILFVGATVKLVDGA